MPYELSFTKPVTIRDRERYINECCVGGDIVVDWLLPSIRERCADIETEQEDWGWFIWFREGGVKLAVDVHTDDGDAGRFRIRATSRVRRLLSDKVVDTPELEELRARLESRLLRWGVKDLTIERVDD
ncbi:MAG TPA: hypothetical protein VFV51_03195 [Vicinamibacterales bacterium]|nr:hypothetical protein [Vicinamibacterales bacterium]